jgi:hypothetical protein
MAEEQWLSFQEAVERIRSRLNTSIGKAQALLKAAVDSGEVRSKRPDEPVLLTADDALLDFNLRPGALNKGAMTMDGEKPSAMQRMERLCFSNDDLDYWLDEQCAPQTTEPTAPSQPPQHQPALTKFQRAESAVKERWLGAVPATLQNKDLCVELRAHCEKLGVALDDISNDTILRAAARK